MEYLLNQEILQILHRVQSTIETVLRRNKPISSVNDYLLSESGMEKLDAACMLIQAIGENLKSIDNKTHGTLFSKYPQIPWRNIFRMCDYISHHYDGVDAEIVFDVIKDKLPPLLVTVSQIIKEIE